MNSDWMAATSFGRAYEVISAINILSIHIKLAQAGIEDPQSGESVEHARSALRNFIMKLDTLLVSAEKEESGLIIGVDPRMGELAESFLREKKAFPATSELFRLPLSKFQDLVSSEKAEDMPELVNILRDLRVLIEQHSHSGVTGILGDV